MPDLQHDLAPATGRSAVQSADPHTRVWEVIRGPWRFAAIYALARLGCPAHLAAGPLSILELADRCEVHPAALERLLRCAAGIGLLAQTSPGSYTLTSQGRVLVPGVPGSMHNTILATGDAAAWQALTGLAATARTGEPAFTSQHGQHFHGYLAAHPDQARMFSDFVDSCNAGIASVLTRLDFSSTRVLADIGGRHGTILAAILAAHPHLHGILFDRALGGARDYLADAALTGRTELVPGDYLAGPVPAADTYLLVSILHNHDDGQARVILGNIRAAATSGPRLLLADMLLPDHPAPHIGNDLDMQMMALGTGRERTRDGYLTLLREAGFTETAIIGTPYGLSVIDARPAHVTGR